MSGVEGIVAQSAAGGMEGYQIFLVVLGLTIIMMVFLRMRYRAKRAEPGVKYHRSDESKFRDSVEKLLVELQEISREMNAKISTKMHILNRLIEESNEKIKELKTLLEREAPAIGQEEASQGSQGDNSFKQRGIEERYKDIYELADSGKSAMEISREKEIERSEVELILSLRRKG